MARFSEEEVFTLLTLVNFELNGLGDTERGAFYQEYGSHLELLSEKLNKYYDKHYPEDENDDSYR